MGPIESLKDLAHPELWDSDEEYEQFIADLYLSRRAGAAGASSSLNGPVVAILRDRLPGPLEARLNGQSWGPQRLSGSALRSSLAIRRKCSRFSSGLDPKGLGVPEVAHLRREREYRAAAAGFAQGGGEAVGRWLVHCCAALSAGAREATSIAQVLAAG